MQFQLNAVHKIFISMNVIKSFILFIAIVAFSKSFWAFFESLFGLQWVYRWNIWKRTEVDALRNARVKSFAAGTVNFTAEIKYVIDI